MDDDFKIDNASYNEGRADFDNGLSLRSIVERGATAKSEDDADKAMSRALGFADAFIDLLRNQFKPF